MKLTYIILKEDIHKKLRDVLRDKLYISHILLRKLKGTNSILVNGIPTFVNYLVQEYDQIEVCIDNEGKHFSDKFKLHETGDPDILFEDDYLLIVNKPARLPVHPSFDHQRNTLSHLVAAYLEKKHVYGIHILTRLDSDTTGICLFAKNEYIQELFNRKKEQVKLTKEYIAIVEGILQQKQDIVCLPIGRKTGSIIEREVNEAGDMARTEYMVMEENTKLNYCILRLLLHTGRTHQIRVHMAHLGHPLLGDDLYAAPHQKETILDKIPRQALHCSRLHFYHPLTNALMEIRAPLPDDMAVLCHNKNL